jgi:predicted Rossmann fold flavoprotein
MDIAVIGGGPAGMMAAITAAGQGLSVAVFEKNNMLGRKLRITGKGRCNITNACDFDTLMENIPGGGKFMYSSFWAFSNCDLIDFLEANGLPTVTERGMRVFPASQKAADVAECLKKLCKKQGVEVRYAYEVTDILTDADGIVTGVACGDSHFTCKAVVIATGGISYPLTGSTGDGYTWARKFGHTVVAPRPSLVGLNSPEKWVGTLEGLSLKNIGFRLYHGEKQVYEDFGEMLFTHRGISGPVVLSGSRHVLDFDYKNISASIDLKPALDMEKLDNRLRRDFAELSRKQVSNALGGLLPKRMIPVVLQKWGIKQDLFVNQVTKEQRRKLAEVLKAFTLRLEGSEGFERAVVTAGGVKLSEVNPRTMASKFVPGLYFAGELLDVDGYTGGFNLTVAFSTGYSAGRGAAAYITDHR